MGNAGACATCCTDIQKHAPFVQYVAENNPCFSEEYNSTGTTQGLTVQVRGTAAGQGQASGSSFHAVSSASAAPKAARAVSTASETLEPTEPPVRERQAAAPVDDLADAGRAAVGGIRALESERESIVTDAHSGVQGSAAASDSTVASAAPDVGQAQQVVKNFVRAYVKGHDVNVLSVNGGLALCTASLDRKLTTLSLQRAGKKDGKKRGVPLEDIVEICVGEEADDVDLQLDELCVTLLLQDGSALGFRFKDVEERDTFALCLSMFVDGRRGEVQKKRKQKASAS